MMILKCIFLFVFFALGKTQAEDDKRRGVTTTEDDNWTLSPNFKACVGKIDDLLFKADSKKKCKPNSVIEICPEEYTEEYNRYTMNFYQDRIYEQCFDKDPSLIQSSDECSEISITKRLHYCLKDSKFTLRYESEYMSERTCANLKNSENCTGAIIDECKDPGKRYEADKALYRLNALILGYCTDYYYPRFGERSAPNKCRYWKIKSEMKDCFSGVVNLFHQSNPQREDLCREFETATICSRSLADECLNDEKKAEMEKRFSNLKKRMGPLCPSKDLFEDVHQYSTCVKENYIYINGCLIENETKALAHFLLPPNPDANVVMCTLYYWISDCVIKRTGEKCGTAESDKMRDDLKNPSKIVKDACDASFMVLNF